MRWGWARASHSGKKPSSTSPSTSSRDRFAVCAPAIRPEPRPGSATANRSSAVALPDSAFSFRSRHIAVDLHHLLLAGLPAHLCENTPEPTRRRIIFSIALFPIAATALFLFRLTKSRRTFYAQIECLCFHTASVVSRPSPYLT